MGTVIPFEKRTATPRLAIVPSPQEEESGIAPAAVLASAQQECSEIADILILMRDKHGVEAIISNLESPADNLLFIRQMEQRVLNTTLKPTGGSGGYPPQKA